MSTHKHIDKICVFATALVLLLTILFMNGKALGISVITGGDNADDMFTENDLNADWNTGGATEITLSDGGSAVKGNGAYVYGNDVHIVYAGKYVISGELSNGSIIISADGDDKIRLLMNGASVNCDDGAAIRIEQAGKVFMTLADGTENSLSSGEEYSSEAVSAGVDGTIYSRDDLTINGSGSLNVAAEYRHGIVCNDDLVITGGKLSITAAEDGIHANDSVRLKNADIDISAGDDGITVSNDDNTAFLYVQSGDIDITECYEGMEAIDITIEGGDIDIFPTDDGLNANGNGASAVRIMGGDITIINNNGRDADGIDSNKDIYISGGSIFVSVPDDGSSSAIDYGSENSGVCEVSGGTVIACGSSGMAEGFDSSSTQGFLMYNTSASAGTAVTLENSEGGEIVSAEIPLAFSSVLISSPEMAIGDICVITVGETVEEVTVTNTSNSSGFGGGMQGGMQGGGMQNGRPNGDRTDFGGHGGGFSDMPTLPDGENGAPSDMPIPPDGTDSTDTPPELSPGNAEETSNNVTPPQFPDGAASGDDAQPPELPDGEIGGTIPDFSQNDGNHGGFNGGVTQKPNDKGNMDEIPGESANGQAVAAGGSLSANELILLGVSAGVLVLGCVIAFIYRRR